MTLPIDDWSINTSDNMSAESKHIKYVLHKSKDESLKAETYLCKFSWCVNREMNVINVSKAKSSRR